MASQVDKMLGCIYGLAIGDALGAPTEFMRFNEIFETFGPEGVADFEEISKARRVILTSYRPKGSYTDDTQMSLATARALINANTNDLEKIMLFIREEYIKWYKSMDKKENIRAPGETCILGVKNMMRGVHWSESGIKDSKGCGAAMRSAPIGLCYDNLDKIVEIAYAVSACTHANPTAIASGIGTAYLAFLAFNDEPPENMANKLEAIGRKIDLDFAVKINQINKVLGYKNHHVAMKELGEGWDGEEAVALALYCFLKNPNDYKKTVLMAANTSGDSDSIACISGAISGAYNGIAAIPEKWIREVENSGLLNKVAMELYDLRKTNESR